MLLKEFKQISDIDNQINSMHKQLADLYARREQYITQPGKTQIFSTGNSTTEIGLKTAYTTLQAAWKQYGINIPPIKTIKKRLLKAHDLIQEMSSVPDLQGNLDLLLVPPAKLVGRVENNSLRQKQSFITLPDFISYELPRSFSGKSWHLLVVYNGPQGLEWGTARDILDSKKYLINGRDARGLGLYEYFSLSLQASKPLDEGVWTSLLKNTSSSSKMVPSATFHQGQYRFELDDVRGVLGDERFRPAIEV